MAKPAQISEYSDIIDARSPAEYAKDHIPGALNLPAFSNAERAAVGTLYKKDPFAARRYGATLFIANVTKHLNGALAERPADWAPLIYCARGGQRSGGMVEIMRRIGWRAEQLSGGYKAYRQHVIHTISDCAQHYRWIVIAGKTGVGKTRLLSALQSIGAQVVNLEKIANHRGSVFGGDSASDQPQQCKFESALCAAVSPMDKNMPVFIEAESRKIGSIHIPAQLLIAMRSSPALHIEAPIDARVDYILSDYQEFCRDRNRFAATIDKLKIFAGKERITNWLAQYDAGEWRHLVAELLQNFYDIGYHKSLNTNYRNAAAADIITLDPNNSTQLIQTAQDINRKLGGVPSGAPNFS